MEVSIMTIKISEEINEAKNGNELDDQETPIVYPEEFEIIDDENDDDANDDDANEDHNYRVTIENNSFTMFTAFFGTGKTGFLNADEEVYGLIQSENPYVQWAGTQVLGQVANEKAINLLLKALNNPSFDVRWGAAMAIAEVAKKWFMWHLVLYLKNQDDKYLDRVAKAFKELWNE